MEGANGISENNDSNNNNSNNKIDYSLDGWLVLPYAPILIIANYPYCTRIPNRIQQACPSVESRFCSEEQLQCRIKCVFPTHYATPSAITQWDFSFSFSAPVI
jgi:hypothetical protein